jgi:hypothetical protein
MHAYAYANAMQLRTKHLRCYRGGRGWLGLGQAQAQLAVARPLHHPRPRVCQNQLFSHSMLRRTEKEG